MPRELEQNRKFVGAINLISSFIFVVFFSLVSIRLSLLAYLADNYPSPEMWTGYLDDCPCVKLEIV